MNILLSQRAIEALAAAPLPVQKAFIKQLNFLCRNLQHPSLHAKKFDESQDRWQARDRGDGRRRGADRRSFRAGARRSARRRRATRHRFGNLPTGG
jgi:hypothetical protein